MAHEQAGATGQDKAAGVRAAAAGPTVPALDELSPTNPAPGPKDNEYVFDPELARPVIEIFGDHCGPVEVERLLEDLGLATTLRRGQRLLSVSELRQLNHAAVARSGNRYLTYEAGLKLIGPRFLGASYHALKALALPRLGYSLLPELTRKYSRVTRWTLIRAGFVSARLAFNIEPGHSDDPLFCHNRQGVLAGLVRAFGLPVARVEHPECIHTGHAACVYDVRWTWPVAADLLLLALGGVAGLAAALLPLGVESWGPAVAALSGVSAASFMAAFVVQRRRTDPLVRATQDQILANLKELEQHHARMSDLALVDEVDNITRAVPHVETLVDTALTQIRDRLGFRSALFVPVQGAHEGLPSSRARGLDEAGARRSLSLLAHVQGGREHDALFADVLQTQRGRVVEDLSELHSLLGPHNREQLSHQEMKTALLVPVVGRSQPLGVLLLDMGGRVRLVAEREQEAMERLGHLLGMALDNARLVQDLKQKQESLEEVLHLTQKLSLYLPGLALDEVDQEVQRHREIGAAVLFSDIIGFTEWASHRTPEGVFTALNTYFAAMDAIVAANGGIVDKRIGDGLMVVFPEVAKRTPRPDSGAEERVTTTLTDRLLRRATPWAGLGEQAPPAHRALRCGLQMQDLMARADALGEVGPLSARGIRVGVAYGQLAAGVIGQGGQRLEYTVIGDTVNVASRLEGLGAPGQVVATWDTLLAAGPERFVHAGREQMHLSKRQEPIEGVRVSGLRPAAPTPGTAAAS